MTAADILSQPIDPAHHRTDDEATLGEYVAAILNQYLQEGDDFDVKRPLGNPRWGYPIDDILHRQRITRQELFQAIREALSTPAQIETIQPTATLDIRLLVQGTGTMGPLADIGHERALQDERFGEQNHTDGTGLHGDRDTANFYRSICDFHTTKGTLTWRHILEEEVHETFAETDNAKLRAELIQVAAVATAWVEHIDRRPAPEPEPAEAERGDCS